MEPVLISCFCNVKSTRAFDSPWMGHIHRRLAPSRRWYSFTYPGRMEAELAQAERKVTQTFKSRQIRDRTEDLAVGKQRSYSYINLARAILGNMPANKYFLKTLIAACCTFAKSHTISLLFSLNAVQQNCFGIFVFFVIASSFNEIFFPENRSKPGSQFVFLRLNTTSLITSELTNQNA